MESINNAIYELVNTVSHYMPKVVGALLILIIGWIVAVAISKSVKLLLNKAGLDERIKGKSQKKGFEATNMIVKVVYYLILLFVLIITLEVLGVKNSMLPLVNMYDQFLKAIPNILAAGVITLVGYILAKVLAGLVNVLTSGMDNYNNKIGVGEDFSISKLASQLTFIFVFIPIFIAALDTLKIETISKPAISMMNTLLDSVPYILAAALIIGIAYILGRFVSNVVAELLKKLGADEMPEKVGIKGVFTEKFTFSKLCSGLLFVFIMLAAAIGAVDKLNLGRVSEILNSLLLFAGDVTLGLIILGIGNVIASIAYNALNKTSDNKLLANIVRFAILCLVISMGLKAMNIADNIVESGFILTLGAIALAIAIAFGLGGREAAGQLASSWVNKITNKK